MTNKLALAAVAAATLLTAGCQTFETMDTGLSSLIGKPYKQAFNVLGFPDAENRIDGKRVFSWGNRQTGAYTIPTFSTSQVYTGYGYSTVTTQGSQTQYYDYNCRIDMIVNSKGITENFKYNGNRGGCETYAKRIAKSGLGKK
ncbi:hypothetical protein [Labrenzia sp. PHM005]|uniref:hypothetical protein n=1 Tax=Labrenzia sp. PHM005 TaxID=2590016 RepID=UPI00113FD506|nr:hypothetical protein [Labrenzia sp. PHM005]QDG77692.1 hypothetical protein FJ695_18500 [Labrenzia sp. PHM005]